MTDRERLDRLQVAAWEDLIVVDRLADASRFRRLEANEVEQWLDDYAVGELWEKNILGGHRDYKAGGFSRRPHGV
jgi:hypothetical protein